MGQLHVENRKFGEMRDYCREEMQNWFGPSKKLKLARIPGDTAIDDPLLKPLLFYQNVKSECNNSDKLSVCVNMCLI